MAYQQWTVPATQQPVDARTVDHFVVQLTVGENSGDCMLWFELNINEARAVLSSEQLSAFIGLMNLIRRQLGHRKSKQMLGELIIQDFPGG